MKDKCLVTIHKIKSIKFVQYCHETTHILNVFRYFAFCNSLHCYSFSVFLCVLFNECPSFVFCEFVFYSKIALWPMRCMVKMFVAKMLMVKIPDPLYSIPSPYGHNTIIYLVHYERYLEHFRVCFYTLQLYNYHGNICS